MPQDPVPTSRGVKLTPELLDQLADEAEAGYDLETLHPRGTRVHDEDERLDQYEQERALLATAIEKAVTGQYIGRPPPLLTGWPERAVAAVVSAGWLPPAAVAEQVAVATRAVYSAPPLEGAAAAAGLLTPVAVSHFLHAHGWELDLANSAPAVREVWQLDDTARIMLPMAVDFVDFPQRFRDALNALMTVYGWDSAQLAANITSHGL